MNESWDVRIRERARQYSERTSAGGQLDHWLKAKHDLWQETLAEVQPLAHKINWMREGLDEGTEEGLRAAAAIGCKAMQSLVDQMRLIDQVSAMAGKSLAVSLSAEALNYSDDPDLMDDFLSVEKQILIRTGLKTELADEFCAILKAQQGQLKNGVVRVDIVQLLSKAVSHICEPYDETIRKARPQHAAPGKSVFSWYRKFARSIWHTLGGGLVIAGNVASLHAIGDVTGELSKALGVVVLETGLKKFQNLV